MNINNIKKLIVGTTAIFGFLFVASNAFAGIPELYLSATPVTVKADPTIATFKVGYDTKGDILTSVVVRYGVDSSMSQITSSQTPAGATGTLSFPVSGLTSGQMYYFQAMGVSSSMSVTSSRYTFSTGIYSTPTIRTNTVNQNTITSTGATISGFYDDNGFTMSNLFFEYGISTSGASAYPVLFSGSKGTIPLTLSNLSSNTKYWYRFGGTNAGGTSYGSWYSFDTSTVTPPPPASCSITSFNSSTPSITIGNSVTLSWTTSNCTTATLMKGGSTLVSGPSGSYTDSPSTTTTYYLNAVGTANTDSRQVTVTVVSSTPPTPTYYCDVNYFSVNSNYVTAGTPVVLSWSTSYCSNYTLTANGSYLSSGSNSYGTSVVYPQTTTTYNLNAYGTYGSDSGYQTGTVNNYNPNPNPNPNPYPQPYPNKPTAVSTYVSSLKSASATLQGTVYTNGISPTYAYFEYGTTPSLGLATVRYPIYSSSSNYKKNITGLNPDTIYYFRLVAENGNGASYGNILYFKTAVVGQTIVTPIVNSYTDTSNGNSNNSPNNSGRNNLGAAVGITGGGFLPSTFVGWLFLILFALIVILVARKLFGANDNRSHSQPVH